MDTTPVLDTSSSCRDIGARFDAIVRSLTELRRDALRHFAGTYRHTLRRCGDDFRIVLQRVDLLNGQAPFDYVLQIWV